jgi:hypothetical protein
MGPIKGSQEFDQPRVHLQVTNTGGVSGTWTLTCSRTGGVTCVSVSQSGHPGTRSIREHRRDLQPQDHQRRPHLTASGPGGGDTGSLNVWRSPWELHRRRARSPNGFAITSTAQPASRSVQAAGGVGVRGLVCQPQYAGVPHHGPPAVWAYSITRRRPCPIPWSP